MHFRQVERAVPCAPPAPKGDTYEHGGADFFLMSAFAAAVGNNDR